MNKKKIVITGGPGTGKSTIINALMARGFFCLEEISRQVTLDAQKEGIDQLFLTKPLLFSELLLKGRAQQFEQANGLEENPIFFDRGIPDVLAYMDYIGDTYPKTFIDSCEHLKYDTVFIVKPWKAIYKSDNERYENFDQALLIHENLIKTYERFGYKLIDIPFDTVENRVEFVLKTLNL